MFKIVDMNKGQIPSTIASATSLVAQKMGVSVSTLYRLAKQSVQEDGGFYTLYAQNGWHFGLMAGNVELI